MSFFACPDLFYLDFSLLLYLKQTQGRHEKYAVPVVYHILFERVLFPLGSVGKLARQFKAEFLNGFFDFGFGHGASVFLVGADVFGGDGAVEGGRIKRIVI